MNPPASKSELGKPRPLAQEDAEKLGLPERYHVTHVLGIGNMGMVYKAHDSQMDRAVAIKVMRPDWSQDSESTFRFATEAKAASRLEHPNVCSVHDFGTTEEATLYLVMDCVEGVTLGCIVEKRGPLKPSIAIPLFIQIADALEHAHSKHIVHRDLKPENVMVKETSDGLQAVVVDFGLAKVLRDDNTASKGLTRTGEFMGTPLYMAPEQARGLSISPSSDMYSLGCLMYFVLTGRAPFNGESVVDVVYKHVNDTAVFDRDAIDVPTSLQTIVLKTLEKDAEDRYPNMPALVADLQLVLRGAPLPRRSLKRHRKAARSMVVTVFMFIVGFAVTFGVTFMVQSLPHSAPEAARHFR